MADFIYRSPTEGGHVHGIGSFSAGSSNEGTFKITCADSSITGELELTSYAEVAALMDACRRHLATAVTISPVEWTPHPEFADMEIAEVRGYRIVVAPDSYTIYQEEKLLATGSAAFPKRYALAALEQHRPVAGDAWQKDGWEDVTLARLADLPLDAAARWLARNPRHNLASGMARALEVLKDKTTAANAVEIVRALEHRRALVLVLAKDVPVEAS